MKRWLIVDWHDKEIYRYDTEKEAEAHILRCPWGDYCEIIDVSGPDSE